MDLQAHSLPITLGMVLLMFVLPLIVMAAHRWRDDYTDGVRAWLANENMPRFLRKAVLVMNERPISMSHPVNAQGRVDQVYELSNGVQVLVETKTRNRHRVYASDVYQLSLCAMILMYANSSRVCTTAYVRTVVGCQHRRSVRYHRVKLIAARTLISQLN